MESYILNSNAVHQDVKMICETADKVDVYLNNNNNLDEILDGF